MSAADVKRFAGLFRGNERSYGVWSPKTKKMMTERKPYKIDGFASHLRGVVGIGIVPVMDDAACWFGAIDIDNHGGDKDLDIGKLEKKARQLKLPVIACRSKSGGIHVYLFGSEPLMASRLRRYLSTLSSDLGYPGAEIFPKQDELRLHEDSGSRALGNWINLPYFDADKTNRYAVINGKQADLSLFLEKAYESRVGSKWLRTAATMDFPGAPPCVTRMLGGEGVVGGVRNNALYNITVFLRRAHPTDFRERAFDVNARVFPDPLEHDEATKTIRSASRREYSYKCKEEPCASMCDKDTCVTREFGISKKEADLLDADKSPMPGFTDLKRYTTDPVRWELMVEGVSLHLNTKQLMHYAYVREVAADMLTKLLPAVRQARWEKLLGQLMEKAQVIEAPASASPAGVIWDKLNSFIAKAMYKTEKAPATVDREHLLRGKPILQEKGGAMFVYFRASDFIDYLRKNRAEDLKGPNLWFALSHNGCRHERLRIGKNKVIPVWYVPYDPDGNASTGQKMIKQKSEY